MILRCIFCVLAATLVAFVVISINGCEQLPEQIEGKPSSIRKVTDGNITCYTYFENAISCVRND